MSEWPDADAVYEQLRQRTRSETPEVATVSSPVTTPEGDDLLERLITLEQRLAEDLARKPKHQKPLMQQRWREEIDLINNQLS